MFQVESWSSALPEMTGMWADHYAEFGSSELSLAMDLDIYAALEKLGKLHLVTIREEGELIGYHVAIITTHMHHKNDLHATTDFFYIRPSHRSAWRLSSLLRFILRDLEFMKVRRFLAGTRLIKNAGAIYKRLGFKEIETVHEKVLTWTQ